METYVVTGASGFLGSNVLLQLLRAGHAVMACDISKPPPRLLRVAEGLGKVTWIRMDTTSKGAWQALPQQDYRGLIHAAAVTPPEDDPDPGHTAEVNAFGTVNAATWAMKRNVPRMVFTSSSAVYRYTEACGPLKEDLTLNPRFSYGWTKLAAEGFLAVCREKMGLDCCAVRLPSIYGPWERPTGSRKQPSPIFNLVRAAVLGKQFRVTGADVSRDWTYVGDAARGLIHLVHVRGGPEVLNLSTGKFVSLKMIIQALDEVMPGHDVRLVQSPPFDLRMTGTSGKQPMDPNLLQSTGFSADTSIKKGLGAYLEWIKQQ